MQDIVCKTVLESISAQVAVLDRAGTIVAVNEAWAAFALEQGSEGQIARADVGINYLTVFHQTTGTDQISASSAIAGIQAVLSGRQPHFMLEYPCHSSARQQWHLLSVNALLHSDGGAVVMLQDITACKETATALQENELFRAAFEISTVGMCQAEPFSGRLMRVNRRFCELTGYTEEELLNRTFSELVHPEDRQESLKKYMMLIRGEVADHRNEKRYIRKDGSIWWGHVTVNLVRDHTGQPLRTVAVVKDITARKQSEDEANRYHAQLESVFQAMQQGIFVTDLQGNLLLVNEAAARMRGFATPAEMLQIATRYQELFVFSDAAGHTLSFAEWPLNSVIKGESIKDMELHVKRQDTGQEWDFIFSGEPVRDAQGKPILAVVGSHDITERKEVERKLRKSEERLRLFIEQAPVAMAMFDGEMRYMALSRRWSQFGKYTEDVIGRSLYEVSPEMAGNWRESHQQCLAGSIQKCDGEKYVFADGATLWLKWEMHPWYDSTGQIGGMVIYAENITQRKQTESILKERDERLNLALTAANMGVWNWELQRNQLYWSPETYKLFGVESFQITPERFNEMIHPDDFRSFWDAANAATALHSHFKTEYRVIRPDGEICWVKSQGRAFYDETGQASRFIGIVMDITERKQIEADRNELLRRLITSQEEERRRISLELHDQMGQHFASLPLLLKALKTTPTDSPMHDNLIEQALQITKRLGRDVNNLSYELRPASLDEFGLPDFLTQYIEEWSERNSMAADFHFHGDKKSRPAMSIELTLYRVIQEALTNILKHAQAKNVSVVLEYLPDQIKVIVEDNGTGLPANIAVRKPGASNKLGLIGMRERLGLVRGKLEIESQPGEGTTLYINIPQLPAKHEIATAS